MIIIFFLFIFHISYFILPTPAIAQTPTVDSVENIQSIREVVQQKVKEKLQQITNSGPSKKSIIGKVIQIDSSSVTIEYQGSTRSLVIDSDVTLVNATGSKITIDKIKVGQDIIAMGVNDTSGNIFNVKRIVLTDLKKVSFSRTIVVGKIVDVSKTSSLLTLISSKNKNDLYQVKTDAKTDLTDKDQKKIKTTDIKAGQRVITILTPDEKISKTYYALKLINLDYLSATSPTPTKKP